MKTKFICTIICLFLMETMEVLAASIQVIPYPAKVTQGEGSFVISPETEVIFSKGLESEAAFYREVLELSVGWGCVKIITAPSLCCKA